MRPDSLGPIEIARGARGETLADGRLRLTAEPAPGPWTPLVTLRMRGPVTRVMVGGAFYGVAGDGRDPADLAGISLFPAYCWFRLDPLRLEDGGTVVPALYVGMPVALLESEGEL